MATRVKLAACVAGLILCICTGCWALHAQSYSSSTVVSVNGAQGTVTVPYLQRGVGSANAASGSATINFVDPITNAPVTFNNMPMCMEQLTSAQTNYVFSKPVVTAKTLTSITYSVSAASKVVTIALGGLTVWATPPSDLVISVFCVAAP